MAGEDWQRLADYVVARRVELGMRDRRAFAEATGSAGPRVRVGGSSQAGNPRWGRRTSGRPSMRTRRCGTSRALRGCLPTWFAASSPSPGTGGKARAAQMSRPGSALDR
jgi:hypothetical protein